MIVPYYYEDRKYYLPGDEGFIVEDIIDGDETGEKYIKLKGYSHWFPMEWFRVWKDSLIEAKNEPVA